MFVTLYEFPRGFTAEGAMNWSGAAEKLAIFHIMRHHFSDILRFVIHVIVKALNGFRMILRQLDDLENLYC